MGITFSKFGKRARGGQDILRDSSFLNRRVGGEFLVYISNAGARARVGGEALFPGLRERRSSVLSAKLLARYRKDNS